MGAVVMFGSRGRRPIHPVADVLRLFPHGYRQSGMWLYAIGFSDGRVKIGVARRPRERLRQYWNAVGGAVQWAHVFERVCGLERVSGRHPVEAWALANACAVAQRIGRSEYFTGLSKDEALRCVRASLAEWRSKAA